MKTEERIQMIKDYAKKVKMYPKGSKGYDPVDLMNLDYTVDKHQKEINNKKCTCETPSEIIPGYKFCSVCACQISK